MKTRLLIIFLVVPLILAACGAAPSQPTPDAALIQTSAANTVIANFTKTAAAAATFTPLAAVTTAPAPLETQTPSTPGASPAPSGTPGTSTPVVYDYFSWNPLTVDVNIPDGTQMTPGQTFVKTWRIKNIGVNTWGAGYKVICSSQCDQLPGVAQPLNGVIGPGQEVEISVQFKAPTKAGTYSSAWTLQNAAGINFFGMSTDRVYIQKPLFLKIVVKL